MRHNVHDVISYLTSKEKCIVTVYTYFDQEMSVQHQRKMTSDAVNEENFQPTHQPQDLEINEKDSILVVGKTKALCLMGTRFLLENRGKWPKQTGPQNSGKTKNLCIMGTRFLLQNRGILRKQQGPQNSVPQTMDKERKCETSCLLDDAFIPRKLFLSSVVSFKKTTESAVTSIQQPGKFNAATTRPVQCTSSPTGGRSLAGDSCAKKPRPTWRKRFLDFFKKGGRR